MSESTHDDNTTIHVKIEKMTESSQDEESGSSILRSRLAQEVPNNSAQSDKAAKENDDSEMLNMFASVWVKVEVEEKEAEQTDSYDDSIDVPSDRVNTEKQSVTKNKSGPKQFSCTYCQYTTKYKNCLISHIYGHENKKPFQCEFCEYASKYSTALYRHVMVRHNEAKAKQLQELESNLTIKPVKMYNCEICEYKTPYKWNLSSHNRAHRIKDDKRFRCEVCGYATAFKHNIDKHRKTHGDHVFRCEKCPFITKYEGHLTRHLVKIHNEDIAEEQLFNCGHCKFGTKYNWRLNIHKSRMKRDEPIKCMYCSFQTHFKCESKLHRNMHFPTNDQVMYTDNEISSFISQRLLQNEEFSNETDLKAGDGQTNFNFNEHCLNASNNTDNSNIDESNKVNDSTYELNNTNSDLNVLSDNITALKEAGVAPIVDSHGQANNYVIDPRGVDWNSIDVLETLDKEKPFSCTACKYSAKFKASVQRHFQRLHTNNEHKPYRCTNCDFSTKTKDQIALHNKRSQSDVVLNCKLCNFTTTFKCAHGMHQKTHYEHKCAMCNHITKHRHDLQKHIALEHMGAGSKCRFCDFKTTRKDIMLTHEAAHTGFKPFQCTMCDYASVRRSLLHNHFQRNHCQQTAVSENVNSDDLTGKDEEMSTKE